MAFLYYWHPLKPSHLNVSSTRRRLMLCDSADGSPGSGPAHKSMFNGTFFSFHHYPLCRLSSGCLVSAQFQCVPVRYNLRQAICCVPWELRLLCNFFVVVVVARGCFILYFRPGKKIFFFFLFVIFSGWLKGLQTRVLDLKKI